jgi:hypothetical protein
MNKDEKKITLGDILPQYTLDDLFDNEDEDDEEYGAAVDEATADIKQRLKSLEKFIERKLTEDEEHAILGIVQERSPKDLEGYITLYFSFIQAWKIYKHQRKSSNKKS